MFEIRPNKILWMPNQLIKYMPLNKRFYKKLIKKGAINFEKNLSIYILLKFRLKNNLPEIY